MDIDSLVPPLLSYYYSQVASAAEMYTKSVFRYKLLADQIVIFLQLMLIDWCFLS